MAGRADMISNRRRVQRALQAVGFVALLTLAVGAALTASRAFAGGLGASSVKPAYALILDDTDTPTSTPTNTATVTNTPTPNSNIINGHLTWQGVDAANRPLVTGTLQLCVSGSTQTFNFTTDAGGYFTLTNVLPDGTYHWWTKGGRHISNASPASGPDLVIINGYATQEFGQQRGGNSDFNNVVNANDFNDVKHQFGLGGIRSADFDYNTVVNALDFNIQKGNFGQAGYFLTCP